MLYMYMFRIWFRVCFSRVGVYVLNKPSLAYPLDKVLCREFWLCMLTLRLLGSSSTVNQEKTFHCLHRKSYLCGMYMYTCFVLSFDLSIRMSILDV